MTERDRLRKCMHEMTKSILKDHSTHSLGLVRVCKMFLKECINLIKNINANKSKKFFVLIDFKLSFIPVMPKLIFLLKYSCYSIF